MIQNTVYVQTIFRFANQNGVKEITQLVGEEVRYLISDCYYLLEGLMLARLLEGGFAWVKEMVLVIISLQGGNKAITRRWFYFEHEYGYFYYFNF